MASSSNKEVKQYVQGMDPNSSGGAQSFSNIDENRDSIVDQSYRKQEGEKERSLEIQGKVESTGKLGQTVSEVPGFNHPQSCVEMEQEASKCIYRSELGGSLQNINPSSLMAEPQPLIKEE